MIEFIWEDIEEDCAKWVVTPKEYCEKDLSNKLYSMLNVEKINRKKLPKNNNSKINSIINHGYKLKNDNEIKTIAKDLYKDTDNLRICDYLYMNLWYRKLLRINLERTNLNGEIPLGLIITKYENTLIDRHITKSLKYLKIICKYLAIKCTYEQSTFDVSKLDDLIFWNSVSKNFLDLFGEEKINIINIETDELYNVAKSTRYEVLLLINNIFYLWSGSTIVFDNDKCLLIPASFTIKYLHQ
jgi:hypothetical protein